MYGVCMTARVCLSRHVVYIQPFVGVKTNSFEKNGGPIGWETYQPVTQLWLFKYYGDMKTMADSYEHTFDYIKMIENKSNSGSVDGGLGDW